ncbi:hypothetical protein ABIA33_005629 [Streptacidiphilus sp. MAP12-16]|uniref:hypothetical protein n=1 Tax=Streptacidiphilus sp. MAP12-16 TaxID=3156300 RepID=UPI0035132432
MQTTPPPVPAEKSHRWKGPAPDTRFGVFFWAVLAGLAVWLLVDVLPHHLYFGWR